MLPEHASTPTEGCFKSIIDQCSRKSRKPCLLQNYLKLQLFRPGRIMYAVARILTNPVHRHTWLSAKITRPRIARCVILKIGASVGSLTHLFVPAVHS